MTTAHHFALRTRDTHLFVGVAFETPAVEKNRERDPEAWKHYGRLPVPPRVPDVPWDDVVWFPLAPRRAA